MPATNEMDWIFFSDRSLQDIASVASTSSSPFLYFVSTLALSLVSEDNFCLDKGCVKHSLTVHHNPIIARHTDCEHPPWPTRPVSRPLHRRLLRPRWASSSPHDKPIRLHSFHIDLNLDLVTNQLQLHFHPSTLHPSRRPKHRL